MVRLKGSNSHLGWKGRARHSVRAAAEPVCVLISLRLAGDCEPYLPQMRIAD